MLENMGGVHAAIARIPLDPRLRITLNELEAAGIDIAAPPATGVAAVRDLLTLTEGQNIMAGVLASMLSLIPDDEVDEWKANQPTTETAPAEEGRPTPPLAYAGEDEEGALEQHTTFRQAGADGEADQTEVDEEEDDGPMVLHTHFELANPEELEKRNQPQGDSGAATP